MASRALACDVATRVPRVRAWDVTPRPLLSGTGPQVHVFDTATGAVQPVVPVDGTARMYVCGITPYDATHMGHAATYVAFDVLHRALLDAGHRVHYVQNITDVDEPLLERAAQTGLDWRDIAEREVALFREDMTALNVLPPQAYIGAVEAIPLVITWIERLVAAGVTYVLEGDVYLDVLADAQFGRVSGWDHGQMIEIFAQRGGDPQRPGKRHPLDPVLWWAERAGEPAWDSPFGAGRPGWHIECVAIAAEHLGTSFDIQGGGRDLVFPHHEMCAAQGHLATSQPFARHYVHAGMIGLEGEKMSKSLGNLVLVSRLRDSGVDPMAIRLALMSGRYATDRDWSHDLLTEAENRLARWRAALEDPVADPAPLVHHIRYALSQDLDTQRAIHEIDAWFDSTNHSDGTWEHTSQVLSALDSLLGVRL